MYLDVYSFFHKQFIGQSIVIQNSLGAILGNRNRKLEEIAVSQKSRMKYSYIKFLKKRKPFLKPNRNTDQYIGAFLR